MLLNHPDEPFFLFSRRSFGNNDCPHARGPGERENGLEYTEKVDSPVALFPRVELFHAFCISLAARRFNVSIDLLRRTHRRAETFGTRGALFRASGNRFRGFV